MHACTHTHTHTHKNFTHKPAKTKHTYTYNLTYNSERKRGKNNTENVCIYRYVYMDGCVQMSTHTKRKTSAEAKSFQGQLTLMRHSLT